MSLSAKEAANLVGLSKTAILKSIRSGKISAEKDVNGEWQIEPVELFRVYKPVADSTRQSEETSSQQSIVGLQRENELLRDTVADLRARLDAESEERRRLSLILNESRSTAPSTEVPVPPSPVVDAAPQVERPKGFWQRLFGP